jgi:hypothetical protein
MTYSLFHLAEFLELHAQSRIIGVPSKAAGRDISSLPATVGGKDDLPNEEFGHGEGWTLHILLNSRTRHTGRTTKVTQDILRRRG